MIIEKPYVHEEESSLRLVWKNKGLIKTVIDSEKKRGDCGKVLKEKDVLDELDMKLLVELQKDCRNSLQEIAKNVGAPYSTVHYRVTRLEKKKIISGYSATIDLNKLGMDYIVAISIWTDFEPEYFHKIGEQLSKISGVWLVYNCLGEINFFVLARANDKQEFLKILDKMMKIKGINRISTHIAAKVVKEENRIDFDVDFEYRYKRWTS